jgi:hypothetical protein
MLGNLLGDPRAALLFIDFERGDLLNLTPANTKQATYTLAKEIEDVQMQFMRRRRSEIPKTPQLSKRESERTKYLFNYAIA